MNTCLNTETDIINHWLASGQNARICGLDLQPIAHPLWPNRPQCVVKGQASVFFLQQQPQGHIWLLKIFAPARRPTDDYLQQVNNCLPGSAEFFTCTQRRLLTADHYDLRYSNFKSLDLTSFLDGAILMPKVPGTTWGSIADDLRDSSLTLLSEQRFQIALNLAQCVDMLEAGQCSHRDLSSTNVFMNGDNRIHLIDWDCLYHPNLSYQPNTTIGTMGYAAPFLNVTSGNFNPADSWCEKSDRFALAILIAEILLTGPNSPQPQEDGTLFSQAQIDEVNCDFIQDQSQLLTGLSPECANLLQQTFQAVTFDQCPSPDDWISTLKYALRKNTGKDTPKRIRTFCNDCGQSCFITQAKYERLSNQGKSILCKNCFN